MTVSHRMTTNTKATFMLIDNVMSSPESPLNADVDNPTILPWLTIEIVLYSLIFTLAIALRLWILDYYPLANGEAAQSLVAFQLYHGEIPTITNYSPLLASLNLFTFFLFEDTDSTARLANVFLGSLLVLLPWLLRRQLGEKSCLVASLLFAFSPTYLFLSRSVNGELGVAVGSLMVVIALLNWAADRQIKWQWLLAIGAVTLLTASPSSYSVLLIFGLLALIAWQLLFKSLDNTLEWAAMLANLESYNEDELLMDDDLIPTETPPTALADWQPTALLFGLFLTIIATAATLNLSGFGVLTNFPLLWVNHFRPDETMPSGFNALILLAFYEPLILTFGFIGLIFAMVRNNLFGLAIGGWFVGLLLIDVIMRNRPEGNVILPLMPLTLLAASALGWLWDSLSYEGNWRDEGILWAVGLIVSAFGYIGLTDWVIHACSPEDTACQYLWLKPVAAIVLLLTVALLFSLISNAMTVWRGLALIVATLTILLSINAATRLNYGPLMDLGYQPLTNAPPASEIVDLMNTITQQSVETNKGYNLIDILVVGGINPTLSWQLRHFPNVSSLSTLAENPTATAIITAATPDETKLGDNYLGQSFELDALWSPQELSSRDLISWLLYRRAKDRPQSNKIVLWLKSN